VDAAIKLQSNNNQYDFMLKAKMALGTWRRSWVGSSAISLNDRGYDSKTGYYLQNLAIAEAGAFIW
jgi:hypothetical protein